MPGMPKGQREQSLILVCVIAIAAIGLYWYMVYSPRSDALAKQQDHIEALATMNQRAKSEMSKGNLSELRAQLATYQQNLSLIRTLVPVGNEVPALLEQVSTAARRAGLDLASVDPQPVQEGSNYDTYRYGMAIVGGYHQLAEFFANVGSATHRAPGQCPAHAVHERQRQGIAYRSRPGRDRSALSTADVRDAQPRGRRG
jgi:type IV pilus assembly protein PilO